MMLTLDDFKRILTQPLMVIVGTLALTSFASNPLAAVPSTFFSVWHNISGSVLSSWWREHDDKHRIHPDSDNGEKGSATKTDADEVESKATESTNA